MANIHNISMAVAAVTGGSTALLQNNQTPSITPMLMTLVSAAVGAIFSYAVLKTTVKVLERDIQEMRRDLGQLYDLVRESAVKIARIEGEMDRDK